MTQALQRKRCWTACWALLQRAPALILVGGIALFLVTGLQLETGLEWDAREMRWQDWLRAALDQWPQLVLFAGGFTLLSTALYSYLLPGYLSAVQQAIRGSAPRLSTVFGGSATLEGRYVPVFGVRLLQTVLRWCALIPISFPFLPPSASAAESGLALALNLASVALLLGLGYLWLGLYFAEYVAATESVGVFGAIRRSWALAQGRRWQLTFFAIANALLYIAGLLALGVGVLLSASFALAMQAEAYFMLARSAPADGTHQP